MSIVAVSLSLAAGCVEFGGGSGGLDTEGMISSEGGDLLGRFTPDPDPPTFGDNALDLELATADGTPIEGAAVTLSPFMDAMGHGSPEVPVVEELGGGEYRATNIVYSMTGEWRLTIAVDTGSVTDSFVMLYQVE
jgi:hypothetical protein